MTKFRAAEGPRNLAPLQMAAPDIEAWLLARDPTAIGAWNSIGPDEYARAFTAARTAGTDVVDDLYFAIVDTVSRGGSAEDFARLVSPTLKAKGWLEGDDGQIAKRVELIYDTNLRLARGAGRWTRYQATKDAFPYLRGFTVGDSRVRHPPHSPKSDHRAWQDIILPVDHPFWLRWWTPLGFRCRCGIMQVSRLQLARRGWHITTEVDLAERERRLGEPVFLSPAQPMRRQLEAMTTATNASRAPGVPPVDPARAEAEAQRAWSGPPARDADALDRRLLREPEPETIDTDAIDKAERDYVLKKGRKAGVEFLVAYDERTGETVERKRGNRDSVSFSPDLVTVLRDPARSIVLHHNHPSSSSLSEPDLRVVLGNPGAKSIWAHGHNGSSYFMQRGRLKWSEAVFRATADGLRASLQASVTAREIPPEAASLIYNHLIWTRLDQLGFVTYRATLAGESAEVAQLHAVVIRRALESLGL